MKLQPGKFPETVVYRGVVYQNGNHYACRKLTLGKQYPVISAWMGGKFGFVTVKNDTNDKFVYCARGFEPT